MPLVTSVTLVAPGGIAYVSLSRERGRARREPAFASDESAEVAALAANRKGERGLDGDGGRICGMPRVGDGASGSSLIGERGNVLELCDRGESTPFPLADALTGLLVVLESVRLLLAGTAGAVVFVLARFRFFCTLRSAVLPVNVNGPVSEFEVEMVMLLSGSLFSLSDMI